MPFNPRNDPFERLRDDSPSLQKFIDKLSAENQAQVTQLEASIETAGGYGNIELEELENMIISNLRMTDEEVKELKVELGKYTVDIDINTPEGKEKANNAMQSMIKNGESRPVIASEINGNEKKKAGAKQLIKELDNDETTSDELKKLSKSTKDADSAMNASRESFGIMTNTVDSFESTMTATTTALSASSERLGNSSQETSGYLDKLTTVLRPGAGIIGMFIGAVGMAGHAIVGFQKKLDIGRSYGADSGGNSMVSDLRSMHVTSLIDPESLKTLGDTLSKDFKVGLGRDQKEMERVATKQRLSERTMGKEYAEDQMAAIGEMKTVLQGQSPSGMMDDLTAQTSALAKTMGVSNKMALAQIKAIHDNTKVVTAGLDGAAAKEIEKTMQGMAASMKEAGYTQEYITKTLEFASGAAADDAQNQTSTQNAILIKSLDGAGNAFASDAYAQMGMDQGEAIQLMNRRAQLGYEGLNETEKKQYLEVQKINKQAQELEIAETMKIANSAGNEYSAYEKQKAKEKMQILRKQEGFQRSTETSNKSSKEILDADKRAGEKLKMNQASADAQPAVDKLLVTLQSQNPGKSKTELEAMLTKKMNESATSEQTLQMEAAKAAKIKMGMEHSGIKDQQAYLDSLGEGGMAQLEFDSMTTVMGKTISTSVADMEQGKSGSIAGINTKELNTVTKDKNYENKRVELNSNGVENAADSMQRTLIKINNSLEESIMSIVNNVLPYLSAAMGALAMTFHWVVANIKTIMGVAGGILLLMLGSKLVKPLLGASSLISKTMKNSWDFIFSGLGLVGQGLLKISGWIEKGGSFLDENVRKLGTYLANGIGELGTGLDDAIKKVGNKLLNADYGAMGKSALQGAKNVGADIMNAPTNIANGYKNAKAAVGDKISSVGAKLNGAKNAVGNAGGNAGKTFTDAGGGLKGSAAVFTKSMGGIYNGIKSVLPSAETLKKGMFALGRGAKSLGIGLVKGAYGAMKGLTKASWAVGKALIKGAYNGVTKLAKGALKLGKRAIGGAFKGVAKLGSSILGFAGPMTLAGLATAGLTGFMDGFKQSTDGAGNSLSLTTRATNGLAGAVSMMTGGLVSQEAATKVLSGAFDSLGPIFDAIGLKAYTIFTDMNTFVYDNMGKIKQVFGNVVDYLISAVDLLAAAWGTVINFFVGTPAQFDLSLLKLKLALSDWWDNLGALFSEAGIRIAAGVEKMFAKIQLWYEMFSFYDDVLVPIGEAVVKAGKWLGSLIGDLFSGIFDSILAAMPDWLASGLGMGEAQDAAKGRIKEKADKEVLRQQEKDRAQKNFDETLANSDIKKDKDGRANIDMKSAKEIINAGVMNEDGTTRTGKKMNSDQIKDFLLENKSKMSQSSMDNFMKLLTRSIDNRTEKKVKEDTKSYAGVKEINSLRNKQLDGKSLNKEEKAKLNQYKKEAANGNALVMKQLNGATLTEDEKKQLEEDKANGKGGDQLLIDALNKQTWAINQTATIKGVRETEIKKEKKQEFDQYKADGGKIETQGAYFKDKADQEKKKKVKEKKDYESFKSQASTMVSGAFNKSQNNNPGGAPSGPQGNNTDVLKENMKNADNKALVLNVDNMEALWKKSIDANSADRDAFFKGLGNNDEERAIKKAEIEAALLRAKEGKTKDKDADDKLIKMAEKFIKSSQDKTKNKNGDKNTAKNKEDIDAVTKGKMMKDGAQMTNEIDAIMKDPKKKAAFEKQMSDMGIKDGAKWIRDKSNSMASGGATSSGVQDMLKKVQGILAIGDGSKSKKQVGLENTKDKKIKASGDKFITDKLNAMLGDNLKMEPSKGFTAKRDDLNNRLELAKQGGNKKEIAKLQQEKDVMMNSKDQKIIEYNNKDQFAKNAMKKANGMADGTTEEKNAKAIAIAQAQDKRNAVDNSAMGKEVAMKDKKQAIKDVVTKGNRGTPEQSEAANKKAKKMTKELYKDEYATNQTQTKDKLQGEIATEAQNYQQSAKYTPKAEFITKTVPVLEAIKDTKPIINTATVAEKDLKLASQSAKAVTTVVKKEEPKAINGAVGINGTDGTIIKDGTFITKPKVEIPKKLSATELAKPKSVKVDGKDGKDGKLNTASILEALNRIEANTSTVATNSTEANKLKGVQIKSIDKQNKTLNNKSTP